MKAVDIFIRVVLLRRLQEMLSKKQHIDPKLRLRMRLRGTTPSYTCSALSSLLSACESIHPNSFITTVPRVLSESGPAHQRQYVVGVRVKDHLLAMGTGHTRSAAEQSKLQRYYTTVGKPLIAISTQWLHPRHWNKSSALINCPLDSMGIFA